MKRFFMLCLFFVIFSVNPVHSICVSVLKANVRTGPGTWYEKMWEVYKYTPLQKVGVSLSGDWYAVRDVDGDVVWIDKKLVTDKYRCAVVKDDKANVRTGPGASRPLSSLSPALHFDSFSVMEKRSEWIKVKDERGKTGWIHRDQLWIQ